VRKMPPDWACGVVARAHAFCTSTLEGRSAPEFWAMAGEAAKRPAKRIICFIPVISLYVSVMVRGRERTQRRGSKVPCVFSECGRRQRRVIRPVQLAQPAIGVVQKRHAG